MYNVVFVPLNKASLHPDPPSHISDDSLTRRRRRRRQQCHGHTRSSRTLEFWWRDTSDPSSPELNTVHPPVALCSELWLCKFADGLEKSHTSAWRTTRDDMRDRLQHINIMVRLPRPSSEIFIGVDSSNFRRTAYCLPRFLHSVPQFLQRIRGYSHTPRRHHTASSWCLWAFSF